MAIITAWEERPLDRPRRHGTTTCGYTAFLDRDGEPLLQLDTYGSDQRKIPGKTSQSIQLDRAGAETLVEILRRAFPGIC